MLARVTAGHPPCIQTPVDRWHRGCLTTPAHAWPPLPSWHSQSMLFGPYCRSSCLRVVLMSRMGLLQGCSCTASAVCMHHRAHWSTSVCWIRQHTPKIQVSVVCAVERSGAIKSSDLHCFQGTLSQGCSAKDDIYLLNNLNNRVVTNLVRRCFQLSCRPTSYNLSCLT